MSENQQNISDHLLDEMLSSDPAYCLDEKFSSKTVDKYYSAYSARVYLRDFLMHLAITISCIGLAIFIIFLKGSQIFIKITEYFPKYFDWVVSAAILFMFIIFVNSFVLRYIKLKRQRT